MSLKDRGVALAFAGVVAVSVAVGAAGGTIFSSLGAHAQTPVSTPAASTPSGGGGSAVSNGAFRSNEDPAHEATESAAREAQEDAGQRPTVQ